mgnify:CR=1 FL=1
MVIGNYKYGISYLPDNCIDYRDGYRYGAYKENINNIKNMEKRYRICSQIIKISTQHHKIL